MPKKLENMTQDERIEYWAKQREKETADRWKRMNGAKGFDPPAL